MISIGDRIISINSVDVSRMTLPSLRALVLGEANTSLSIHFARTPSSEFSVELLRANLNDPRRNSVGSSIEPLRASRSGAPSPGPEYPPLRSARPFEPIADVLTLRDPDADERLRVAEERARRAEGEARRAEGERDMAVRTIADVKEMFARSDARLSELLKAEREARRDADDARSRELTLRGENLRLGEELRRAREGSAAAVGLAPRVLTLEVSEEAQRLRRRLEEVELALAGAKEAERAHVEGGGGAV
jgi:hypothetical protein